MKDGKHDPSLDLPAREAPNFVEAEAVELKPPTKLYRVVGGSAYDTGGYWVTAEHLPKGYDDVIGGTAVKPGWGNGMTEIVEYTVPKGGMTMCKGQQLVNLLVSPLQRLVIFLEVNNKYLCLVNSVTIAARKC